jgi:hypothetical protein
MTYFTVPELSLVLVMGKRDAASFATVYFDIFCALILGSQGASSHSAAYYGSNRNETNQQFKLHTDSLLGFISA